MTVSVLVGTTKGAFILESDEARQNWSVSGPHCDGWPINHVMADASTGTLWAAGGNGWNGAGVWKSTDQGTTWALSKFANGDMDEWLKKDPEMAAAFGNPEITDAPFTGEVEALWVISAAHGRLYAGGKPGKLYASDDDGTSWTPVDAINAHPQRDKWQPGGAGLTLHTIVQDPIDPRKTWIGMSAVGVFATEDGGETWEMRNRRSNEEPPKPHVHADGTVHGSDTEIGSCVHNMVHAGDARLYQQNHEGTFRSSDGGRSWTDITKGLPSSFGFPIAVHPHDPNTAWVMPMNGDILGRFPPGASAKVWKTSDAGDTWEPRSNGLPEKNCFFTVLRQAMATDKEPEPGLYFGTNSGSIFCSINGGDTWSEPVRHLPTILSVETI